MDTDNIWRALGGLFGVVGVLHLFRALRSTSHLRSVRLALALSCFAWGAGAYMLRFMPGPGVLTAFVAGIALMAVAAFYSLKRLK